jgi:hypothetical protein
MDRNILNRTNTMNSIARVMREVSVVVGVAILEAPALLHAQVHSWRWAPSGFGADL